MNLDKQSIDRATEAALECALWTGLKYHPTDQSIEPVELDRAGYGMDDFTKEARARMRTMILSFTRAVTSELCLDINRIPADSFGHDFVLTAQGHGAGFWDRGYGALGEDLSKFARTYSVDVYVTRLDNLGIEA